MGTAPRIADCPPPRAAPARGLARALAGRLASALAGALAGLAVGAGFVAVAPVVDRTAAAQSVPAAFPVGAVGQAGGVATPPVSAVLATAIEAGVVPAPDAEAEPAMTRLDLHLEPDLPPASPAVLAARHRRALVVGLGGGRETDSPMAKSSFAERRLRSSDTAATRFVDPMADIGAMPSAAEPTRPASLAPANATALPPDAASSTATGLRLDDALVVPAGAVIRGYLRCRALLLVGDLVGNVHCTAGPVVIRSGASLKGRLVASGDVYVCGTVGDTGGGAVITTRGKLTLAPGSRVDGDVRSGWLDLYDGAMLHGVAKGCED